MLGEEAATEVVPAPTAAESGLARFHAVARGLSRPVEATPCDDLKGQVVLVAGALGLVALGVADRFRHRGATTLLAPFAGFNPDGVALRQGHIVISGVEADPASLEHCRDEVSAHYGRLDLVVLCSGELAVERSSEPPVVVPAQTLDQPPLQLTSMARNLVHRLLGGQSGNR